MGAEVRSGGDMVMGHQGSKKGAGEHPTAER